MYSIKGAFDITKIKEKMQVVKYHLNTQDNMYIVLFML